MKQINFGYLLFISFVAALGGFLFGYDTAVISGTISQVTEQFGLSSLSSGWYVGRAVMPLNSLTPLVTKNITPGNPLDNRYGDGIICLKGGDLEPESKGIRFPVIEYPVGEFFNEEFFETKKLVYVPV